MERPAEAIARDLDGAIAPAELEPLLSRLDAFAVPEPEPEETASLIASLRPLMPSPLSQPAARFRDVALEPPRATLLRALLPQMRLVPTAWWAGAALAVLAGLIARPSLAEAGIPLAALAPVLVIAGIAIGFGSLKGAALELELSCPITPAQVILSRMLFMLCYGLALGALLTLVGRGSGAAALLSWCASLILFAGVMLTLTLRMGTTTATALSTLLWAAQLLLRDTRFTLLASPGTPAWLPAQVGALVAGAVLLALCLVRPDLLKRLGREDG